MGFVNDMNDKIRPNQAVLELTDSGTGLVLSFQSGMDRLWSSDSRLLSRTDMTTTPTVNSQHLESNTH